MTKMVSYVHCTSCLFVTSAAQMAAETIVAPWRSENCEGGGARCGAGGSRASCDVSVAPEPTLKPTQTPARPPRR